MSIDEAIEKYKLLSTKGNIMFPKRPDIAEKSNRDYKQTAEWLEEYKAFKEGNYAQKYGKCPMCMDCPKNCPLDK